MKTFEADFGFEPQGSAEYAKACVVRSLRVSEITLRARGKFDLANGYRQLADAVERGYVREDHGFEFSALHLGLHSYSAQGANS